MIPVKVRNVTMSKVGFVMLLQGQGTDDRILPVFIGPPEAQAILFSINRVRTPRPLTHDLLKSILRKGHMEVEKVIIHDLREGTFYATLHLRCGGEVIEVDARPSDAVALSLRTGSDIFVANSVMECAGIAADALGPEHHAETEAPSAEGEGDAAGDPLGNLKEEMDRAVTEERYEDAARLRDEIRKRGG